MSVHSERIKAERAIMDVFGITRQQARKMGALARQSQDAFAAAQEKKPAVKTEAIKVTETVTKNTAVASAAEKQGMNVVGSNGGEGNVPLLNMNIFVNGFTRRAVVHASITA